MKKPSWLVLLLSFMLALLTSASFAAGEPLPPEAPPLSPAFLKWQQKQDAVKKGAPQKDMPQKDTRGESGDILESPPNGAIPSPIDRSHLRKNPPRPSGTGRMLDRASPPPTSYDPRNWLPPVRNQNPFGTCWAHAAIGAFESNAISKGMDSANNINLSEMFLAYFTYGDSRAGKSFERPYEARPADWPLDEWDPLLDQGGTADMAVAFMSRQGAIDEDVRIPYPVDSYFDADTIFDTINSNPYGFPNNYVPSFQLRETYDLGFEDASTNNARLIDESERNLAKGMIEQYGAVQISYLSVGRGYHCPDNPNRERYGGCWYGNGATTSFFDNSGNVVNHAVLLVGWDDNFSRTNFGDDSSAWPQNNGAWLVRNSYGSNWGMGGYFWMSYEQYITDGTVYIVEPADNSLRHYGHDYLGRLDDERRPWAANVFRAQGNETVQEIAFYTTDNNAQYEAYIYDLGNTGGTRPSSPIAGGDLLTQTSGTISNAGYHRVALPTPVDVDEGHWFSVVVKMTMTPGTDGSVHNFPTAIESGRRKWTTGKPLANPVVNVGESWFSYNGTSWEGGTDKATCYGNSCHATIKAFTSVQPLSIRTASLSGGFLNQAYTAQLEARGAKPITWTKTSGNLPPGLTLSSDGRITGMPTQTGTYNFTVRAANNTENKTQALSITITEAPVAPTIQTATLEKATLGTFYEATLSAAGTTPITWARASGTLPTGLSISSDGRISGTPTKEGTFNFTVKATNSEGNDTKALSIRVGSAPTITMAAALPGGTLGKAYSATLTAGGTTPITWTRVSGSLPTGLSISPDGRISGTPSALGTFNFTVKATNDWGSATKSLTLTVTEVLAPTIQPVQLPIGKLRTAYDATLTAKGSAPITWAKASGTLPAGLTLSSAGRISGTPTREGAFTFTVKATNSEGSDTKELTLKVGEAPAITTAAELGAVAGTNYSLTLAATGTKAITWSAANLPAWLKLANGRLSGKPTAQDEHTFTVTATNVIGETSKTIKLTVGEKPTITTTFIPGGVVGKTYIYNWSAVELQATGTAPITWSKASGTLPPGLELLENGRISGTPSKQGTFNFTVKATNAMGSATKAIRIVIGEQPTITTTVTKLPVAVVGTNYNFTLAATGTKPITWGDWGSLPPGLKLASNGRLSGKPTTPGSYTFWVWAKNPIDSVETYFVIDVVEKPAITTAALNGGVVGEPYSAALAATGTGPITWSWNGKLPDWLTLGADGTLSGTPQKAGTYSVTAKATNVGGTVTKALKIVIGERPAITTTTETLPGAVVNTNYNFTLAATGTKPIVWGLVSGNLPQGITLAANGRLSGKTAVQGNYTFTVAATNATGRTDTKTLTLTVGVKPVITTTALPDGYVGYYYGEPLHATGTAPLTWTKASGTLPPGLELAEDGFLYGTITKKGTYSFTLKATNKMGTATKALRVIVR